MKIRYPFTMPPDNAADVAKRTLVVQVDGADAPMEFNFDIPEATGSFDVDPGVGFSCWATFTDMAGNASLPSPSVRVDSAADTNPPAMPGAPTLGPGETIPD